MGGPGGVSSQSEGGRADVLEEQRHSQLHRPRPDAWQRPTRGDPEDEGAKPTTHHSTHSDGFFQAHDRRPSAESEDPHQRRRQSIAYTQATSRSQAPIILASRDLS